MTTVNDLPLELIALILNNIPDLLTLLSTIRSRQIFTHAFALLPDSILTSCFDREWVCEPSIHSLRKTTQNQTDDEMRREGHGTTKNIRRRRTPRTREKIIPTSSNITHSNAGRLVLELLALAQSPHIPAASVETMLRTVYAHFQNRLLEESLFPIAIAIARSYLREKNVAAALNILQNVYSGTGIFRWMQPADWGSGIESAERAVFTATRDRRRVSLYPIARLIIEIKESTGIDSGRPVTDLFRRQVRGLRMQFRNAPVLLIGAAQVALFPWAYLHDQPNVLEDGIWVNDGSSSIRGIAIPACVRAIVKVTKWGVPTPRESLLDATARAYRVTPRAAFWQFEGGSLYNGDVLGDSLRIYMGFLPGRTGLVPPEPDTEIEARLEIVRTEGEAAKLETRRKLVSGERGDGELNASEILAAAGDYAAERAAVNLLLLAQDAYLMRTASAAVSAVLRTFHLGTVLRLLRGVEGKGEWGLSERVLESAVQNVHSGAGILRALLEQRGLDWEVQGLRRMQVIVKVAANNEGNGRQIMELLFERQEERDQAAYEAFAMEEG